MDQYNDLNHSGVLGMKWGKRTARGHAGPGKYATKKRQLAGDKKDLKDLKNGKHLSVGLTKERQEKFDARDKAFLEKRIAKNSESIAKKKARMEYINAEKNARLKYDSIAPTRIATGKEFGDRFIGVVATLLVINGILVMKS